MNTKDIEVVRTIKGVHRFLSAAPKEGIPSRGVMVFIHGASAGAWYWQGMLRYFAGKGYVVYAPDLPGHGADTRSLKAQRFADYLRAMEDFLDEVVYSNHDEPVVIVGHSMGGLIAQCLAESKKRSLHAVVLITPAPPEGIPFRNGEGLALSVRDTLLVALSFCFDFTFRPSEKFLDSLFVDPVRSADMRREWTHRYTGEPLSVRADLYRSAIVVNRYDVTAPMFVVGAAHDVVIHPEVGKKIATYYRADYVLLEELGHMCIFEAGWETTAKAIADWLERKKFE